MTPAVSVIVPAYNASETILRALLSVQAQEMEDVETIVVDDGSSDDTVARIEQASLPRVRIIRLGRNRGVSAARNEGMSVARGSLIAFLDSDDEWLPGKLAIQRTIIDDDPNVVIVSSNCLVRLRDGSEIDHHAHVRAAEGPSAWKQLLIENFIATPTVLCRRADLHAVGTFTEGVSYGEDLDIWLRLAVRGTVRVVPQPLVIVHVQMAGLSNSQSKVEVEHVLPLVERFLHDQRARLTKTELRRIVGTRNFDIGYRTYSAGYLAEAKPLFLKAIVARWRVAKSIAFYLDCMLGGRLLSLRRRHASKSGQTQRSRGNASKQSAQCSPSSTSDEEESINP